MLFRYGLACIRILTAYMGTYFQPNGGIIPGDVASGLGVKLGEIVCSPFSSSGGICKVGDNGGVSASVDFSDKFTSGSNPSSLIGIEISFEIVSVFPELVNVTFAIRSWIDLSVKVLFSSAFPELRAGNPAGNDEVFIKVPFGLYNLITAFIV